MNTLVTSKKDILIAAKAYVQAHGLTALNMRSLSQEMGIAVGSLYHYFPSKEVLMEETVASVWEEIFLPSKEAPGFLAFLQGMEHALEEARERYPGFFSAHTVSFTKENEPNAHSRKMESIAHLKAAMLQAYEHDPRIRPEARRTYPPGPLIDLFYTALLYSFLQGENSFPTLEKMTLELLY